MISDILFLERAEHVRTAAAAAVRGGGEVASAAATATNARARLPFPSPRHRRAVPLGVFATSRAVVVGVRA